LAAVQPSFAQKFLTTEPLTIDPYAVVYVNDGLMFGRKNTQGYGRYSRPTPRKVLRIRVIRS
jgi:hypothetical protein